MTRRSPAALVLLLATAAAQSSDTGQVVRGNKLVDHDYRFEITAPEDWRILPEKDARRVVPDAVAGLMREGGLFAAVIVEEAPEGTAKEWATTILGAMTLEAKEQELLTETRFAGRDAVRAVTSGRFRDVSFRYQHVVFKNGGYLYQIISWGARSSTKADGSSFQPALDAFTLKKGKVMTRRPSGSVLDAAGVGWRLTAGRFASAAFGFEVVPAAGWTVAVGQEVKTMNAEAEVGLVHPHAYLVILSERAVGVDRPAFQKSLRASVAESATPAPGTVTSMVAGKKVTFHRFRMGEGPHFEMLHGSFFHDDACIQVQTWFAESLAEKARSALPSAFGAIRLLEPKARAALTKELLRSPPPESKVGGTFGLRQGKYRDFAGAFTFTRPPTGFWSLTVGQEARATNPAASLVFEEQGTGLMGLVIAETLPGPTPGTTFHELVVARMKDEAKAVGSTQKTTISGLGGFVTQVSLEVPFALDYRVHTVVKGLRAWQVLVWGHPGNMKKHGGLVAQALGAMRLVPEGLPPEDLSDGVFTDERLGFSLGAPVEGARFQNLLPPDIRGLGTGVMFSRGNRMSMALAMCPGGGQDAAWFRQFVGRAFLDRMKKQFSEPPEESEVRFLGQPATRFDWDDGRGRMAFLFFSREQTFFAVAAATDSEEGVAIALKRFKLR